MIGKFGDYVCNNCGKENTTDYCVDCMTKDYENLISTIVKDMSSTNTEGKCVLCMGEVPEMGICEQCEAKVNSNDPHYDHLQYFWKLLNNNEYKPQTMVHASHELAYHMLFPIDFTHKKGDAKLYDGWKEHFYHYTKIWTEKFGWEIPPLEEISQIYLQNCLQEWVWKDYLTFLICPHLTDDDISTIIDMVYEQIESEE